MLAAPAADPLESGVAWHATVSMIDFNGFHFGRDQSGDCPITALARVSLPRGFCTVPVGHGYRIVEKNYAASVICAIR